MWLYTIGKAVMQLPMRLIYRITVSGREHIPTQKDKGFILAANHISALDPIVLGINIKPQIHFMGKEELFQNPLVGWVLRHVGAFAVARGKGDLSVIDQAGEVVKKGEVMGIFPEGTRSKTGELLKPKSGVILVAANTGGDILPAAITMLPKRKFHRKHIHIMFGEMIENKELAVDGPKNLAKIKSASKLLMARIAELREATLQAYKDET